MRLYKVFIAVIIFLTSASMTLQAQKNHAADADLAFNNYQYYEAIDLYKKAYSKIKSDKTEKTRILFQIAESYRMINDAENAAKWYERAIQKNYSNNIVYYQYAQMLRQLGRYDEAITQFKLYEEKVPNDPKGKIGEESAIMAKKWKDTPSRYKIAEAKIFNSKQSDFSPFYIDQERFNTLVLTSSRESSTGNKVDAWTGESFSDVYISRKDRKGFWSTPVTIGTPINSEHNEGSVSINRKGTEMYFTKCLREKKKDLKCKIYHSQLAGNNWSDPVVLDLAPDSFSIGHPFISDDELMLVFSGDLPGGYGSHDLWMSKRSSKGDVWGKPENLGQEINTSGNEQFPYIRSNGDLYFASDGRIGMGGLDIFKAEKNDKYTWKKPEFFNIPLNSSSDDFGIVFEGENEKGYFSTNRNQKTSDDIYYFWLPNLLYTLKGKIVDDSTKQPIENVIVKVTDSDGKSFEGLTNKDGVYSFDTTQILPNKTYTLLFTKEPIYLASKGQTTTVGLEESKDLELNKNLIPIPKKPIVLPEILYDLNKWDIKPEFHDSLNGLYQTLIDNPKIVVEISSHTDPRASDAHNDTLSQKRAQSVVDYLVNKGIEKERMVAKGYGEKDPRVIKKDMTVTYNGKKYSFRKGTVLNEKYILSIKDNDMREAAYQLDRRSEFRILRQDYIPK